MSESCDHTIMRETRERIRRAELATLLYPPGSREHARAVERLGRATRQMERLERGHREVAAIRGAAGDEPPDGTPSAGGERPAHEGGVTPA
jgi:hypothetical protein